MAMLYKCCSVFLKESNKIGLHFYDVSTNFYGFYKFQQNNNTIEVSTFE
jgi:hypothetical protein